MLGSLSEADDSEQEALLADSVGLALLVVLETLAPAERVAFVLHDLFDLSFDEIAPIVGRSARAAARRSWRPKFAGRRPSPTRSSGAPGPRSRRSSTEPSESCGRPTDGRAPYSTSPSCTGESSPST
jgi:hypothetical protein